MGTLTEELVCPHCGLMNDYMVERKENNDVCTCNGCGKFIKNKPYSKPALYFGKYAGQPIEDYENSQVSYLQWVRSNDKLWVKLSPRVQAAILNRLP